MDIRKFFEKKEETSELIEAESIAELIEEILSRGSITSDIGKTYNSKDVVTPIKELVEKARSGYYDRDLDNVYFNSDLLTITRAMGIRDRASELLSHEIVKRQRGL